MLRHMGGGALMGFGGVMAAGCTVGQGLTGVATLGIGSLIALLTLALSCAYSREMDHSSRYNQELAHYACKASARFGRSAGSSPWAEACCG